MAQGATMEMSEIDNRDKITRSQTQRSRATRSSASLLKILAYTFPFFAFQAFFTMFAIWMTPYLLQTLSFPRSIASLILLAGPLTGILAFPLFGVLSDRSGRRMPYFVYGGLTMALCQLVLAWAPTIDITMPGFSWISPRAVAAISVYAGCTGAQAFQVALRALCIDAFPPHQQPVVTLWSARFQAAAAVLLLAVGHVQPSFCVTSAIAVATVVACLPFPWLWERRISRTWREELVNDDGEEHQCGYGGGKRRRRKQNKSRQGKEPKDDRNEKNVVRAIFDGLRTLPPVTRRTCVTQIAAQFSWFPVMHYLSLYLSESYVASYHQSKAPPSTAFAASIRVILVGQVAALLTQIIIGCLWTSESSQPPHIDEMKLKYMKTTTTTTTMRTATISGTSPGPSSPDKYHPSTSSSEITSSTREEQQEQEQEQEQEQVQGQDQTLRLRMEADTTALRHTWAVSFGALGIAILGAAAFRCSFAAASLWAQATFVFSVFANWIPHTMVSYETAVVEQERNLNASGNSTVSVSGAGSHGREEDGGFVNGDDGDDSDDVVGGEDEEEEGVETVEDRTGSRRARGTTATVLSVHNVAITLGQVLSDLVCSLVFLVVSRTGAENTSVWVFLPGVAAAIVAGGIC